MMSVDRFIETWMDGSDVAPIDEVEAARLIAESRSSGEEVPEDLTAEDLANAWNEIVDKNLWRWWLVENRRGDQFEVALGEEDTMGIEEALAAGVESFRRLSAHDQKQTEYCEVMLAPGDGSGNPDIEAATEWADVIEAARNLED